MLMKDPQSPTQCWKGKQRVPTLSKHKTRYRAREIETAILANEQTDPLNWRMNTQIQH